MKTVWYIVTWFTIVTTTAPWIRLDDWWIRGWDFPRLQIVLIGGVCLGTYFLLWGLPTRLESLTVVLLVFCLIFQIYKIYPYTTIATKQVAQVESDVSDTHLSVMIANVYMENRQASQLINIVNDMKPDLLLTVETDQWWVDQFQPLKTVYPYTIEEPLSNTYGMVFYSKFPLINPEIRYLLKKDIPSIQTQILLPSGRHIWFYGLHPMPPSPTEAKTTTRRDAELLIVGREAKTKKQPVIVAGDLNDVAWSYTTTLFQKTSGLLDPRFGRGLYSTFHAKYPFMRWPLDHVFHSDHFSLVTLMRLDYFGSDHFPIYIKLELSQKAKIIQNKPQINTEEQGQVKEKIEAGKEKAAQGKD